MLLWSKKEKRRQLREGRVSGDWSFRFDCTAHISNYIIQPSRTSSSSKTRIWSKINVSNALITKIKLLPRFLSKE
jgi:hypothetical protein